MEPVKKTVVFTVLDKQFENLTPEELEVRAQSGDAAAQYELGLKYEVGNGFPKDVEKSIVLFSRAFAQGHAAAGEKLPKKTEKKGEYKWTEEDDHKHNLFQEEEL